MKTCGFLVFFGFALAFTASDVSAKMSSPQHALTGTITNACTPWDGPSVLVFLNLPDLNKRLSMMVWNKGIAPLEAGQEVTLGAGGSSGNGHATLCTLEDHPTCDQLQVSLTIPAADSAVNPVPDGKVVVQPLKEGDQPQTILFTPVREIRDVPCG